MEEMFSPLSQLWSNYTEDWHPKLPSSIFTTRILLVCLYVHFPVNLC